jgi:hypothetical protein
MLRAYLPEPALLVPASRDEGALPGCIPGWVLSVVPGPLSPGFCVTGTPGAALLPELARSSRRQRVFSAPVIASQRLVADVLGATVVLGVVTAAPEPEVTALPLVPPVALPGPGWAAAASRGVSWPLGPDAPEAPVP